MNTNTPLRSELGPYKIGVDFCGVIFPPVTTLDSAIENDESDAYLKISPVCNAHLTLTQFHELGCEILLVSKMMQDYFILERAHKYLDYHGFAKIIPRKNRHFVRNWAEKAEVCIRLGIKMFIDDKLVCLSRMAVGESSDRMNLIQLYSWEPEVDKAFQYLVKDGVIAVARTWLEIARMFPKDPSPRLFPVDGEELNGKKLDIPSSVPEENEPPPLLSPSPST